MVSMTGYWDAVKFDLLMHLLMVMAMEIAMVMAISKSMAMMMIHSDWILPSMLPSQDEDHTMIGDFTEITLSNSDNDLQFIQAPSARFDSWMLDILEVDIWRMVSLSMFLLSLLLFLLLISLDLCPVQISPAEVSTTSLR